MQNKVAEIWGEIENWGEAYGYEGQSMSLPKWPTSQNSLAEALDAGMPKREACSFPVMSPVFPSLEPPMLTVNITKWSHIVVTCEC